MVFGLAPAAAWIGGCIGADAVRGASSSAEYSRVSRPWPQSTSIRKVSSGCCTGWVLVTRMIGLPLRSTAKVKRRSVTMPCGGSRPMRWKVSGEARPARSCASSSGPLAMTGISASNGWPARDLTSIWPRPSAQAAELANASARPRAVRAKPDLTSGPIPKSGGDSKGVRPECATHSLSFHPKPLTG